MRVASLVWLGLWLFAMAPVYAVKRPNPRFTPGALCSSDDPDFKDYDYPDNVALCNRHVSKKEKQQVARKYGNIPSASWHKYEFDHLIPLCAGGANDIENLWPQPLSEAHEKDKIEDEVCQGMRDGSMSQDEAVQEIQDWFDSRMSRP